MPATVHNLQALRGVACLLVVAFHVGVWEREDYGLHTPGFKEVRWFGFAGVDLFFALSGFVITYTQAGKFGRPRTVPGYLLRRARRIYPPYWIALVLGGLAWSFLLNAPVLGPGWERRWMHWLLLLPGDPGNLYVAPAWTLPHELTFYLAFAALLALPRRWGAVALAGWGLAVLAYMPWWTADVNPYRNLAVSPFVLEFLGGCVAARLVRRGVTGYGRTAAVLGVGYAVGGIVLARAVFTGSWEAVMADQRVRVAVFGPAAVLLVYGLVAAEVRGAFRCPKWLGPVGDASYSIYLIHCAVGRLAVVYGCYLPHSRLPHVGWLMGTFAACVGVGFVLHWLIERPLMRVARRRALTIL